MLHFSLQVHQLTDIGRLGQSHLLQSGNVLCPRKGNLVVFWGFCFLDSQCSFACLVRVSKPLRASRFLYVGRMLIPANPNMEPKKVLLFIICTSI